MKTPLADILDRVPVEHARVLAWFVEHAGEVGARPWRVGGKSVVPGVTIPIVAQRGIHRPSGWTLALSVTATASSMYLDGKPTMIDDSTWVLPYSAHAGSDGSGDSSRWNRALCMNIEQRVPVGVFVPEGSAYRNLGLAMVESYDQGSDTFLLRGPVSASSEWGVWDAEPGEVLTTASALREDGEYAPALIRRRREQDAFRERLLVAYSSRCAITGYDAAEALQGAHILAYSGRSSQKVDNGLLLRADVHLLFDRHLLSIEPVHLRVRLAKRLRGTAYWGLEDAPVVIPQRQADRPAFEKLAVHWAVFERASA